MHILVAILSGLGAVLWAIWRLDREGFDFAALNPFLWKRRAHWRQQYETNPLHGLTSPLEVAAVLMLAVAKESGEIALEEKRRIKALMVSELKRTPQEAEDLFLLSSHLLKAHDSVTGQVATILAPSRQVFSVEQTASLERLLTIIANIDGAPNQRQQALINEFRACFRQQQPSGWR